MFGGNKNQHISFIISSNLLCAGSYLIFSGLSHKNDNPQLAQKSTINRNIINFSKQPTRQPAQISPKNVEKITPQKLKEWKKASTPEEKTNLLEECYKHEGACGFNQEDPRAEHYAIGQALKKELLKIQHQVSENNIKNNETLNLAIRFLKVPDGHVKEAALHLLSTQEKSESALDEILNSIISYHDANLIQQAMLELTRYKKDFGNKIDQALISALKMGSPLVSEQVAKNISLFITESNYNLYRNTLKSLRIGSLSYENLENSLRDFKKKQKAA